MERICTKCGNPIDEGDSFCDVCGAKFEETQTEEKVAVGVKAHDNEAAAEKKLADSIKSLLGVAVKVTFCAPNTIARSTGKAVRVIDNRKLH